MHAMQVVGLTTTEITQDNRTEIQYRILAKVKGKLYDYMFTPNEKGEYTLKTNPTVETTVEMSPLVPTALYWDNQELIIATDNQKQTLFHHHTKELHVPVKWFHAEEEILPKRLVLIVDGNPDNILPFIKYGHQVVYTDTWEHIPSAIPEDIIVLGLKPYPIDSIVMRLPQRTKAVVVRTEIRE